MQETIDTYATELTQIKSQQQHQQAKIPSDSETEEQINKLQEDLAQAKRDAEDLRTAASVNASMSNAPSQDGSKSMAEQIAEHVEAVRVELESRHNERVKQADETLERRTNAMKANLSKKLTEGKNQIRQTLTAEHEQALQILRAEHQQETDRLRTRHQDELEELQRNEDSRFAKLREAWDKEQQALSTTNGQSQVESDAQAPHSPWKPSEEEAKKFVQSNEIVRNIIKKNINIHVTRAKDELSTHMNQEHEKAMAERMAEVQNKANTAKDHAVLMEGKKSAVQLNMANNKARIAQFKLDIVQKAAQETPQKPVEEVWTLAKDAKPPAIPPQQAQQDATKAPKPPGTTNSGQPTPTAPVAAQKQQTQPSASGSLSGISTFGRPTPAAPNFQFPSPGGQQNPGRNLGQAQQLSGANQPQPQPPPSLPPGSNPSQRQSQTSTNNHHTSAGTGPNALRGLQQSGLPVARGGSMRGNTNMRGRGSAMSRGNPQALDVNRAQGQQQGRGSPVSGGLNAAARQFIPGIKRPRDDGQEDGGNGKRIRNGGDVS